MALNKLIDRSSQPRDLYCFTRCGLFAVIVVVSSHRKFFVRLIAESRFMVSPMDESANTLQPDAHSNLPIVLCSRTTFSLSAQKSHRGLEKDMFYVDLCS